MDTHDLNMEVKHIFSKSVKLEEETGGVLSRWAKTALESCGLWSSHVKGKPLMEMAIEEGQTRCLKDEDKTVQKNTTKGGIETSYEDKSKLVKKSTRWKGGTSCKKGRLRKLSKVWFMMRKSWKKDSEFGYLSDNMGFRMIKDVVQQVVRGECSYSAYMGNSVEDNTIMRGLETKGVDDPITK
ncbi:hypothetical protein DY000_02052974 [Brassica cretica]|nr:hypothetical protein DY000_02052974 [Brassica cretica]